jgi:hypothetical protein
MGLFLNLLFGSACLQPDTLAECPKNSSSRDCSMFSNSHSSQGGIFL